MTIRRLPIRIVVAAAMAVACHGAPEASNEAPQGPQPPAGEVWLTSQQVKDSHIDVTRVNLSDLDDTILTAGTVTLDDRRTGHVFSPVTGRVVSIDAQLGKRVTKGQVLAVIESPDVGSAVSDVRKAEADLVAAEHDVKRKKDLYEQHAGTESDLEAAQDNYRRARAEVERAQQKAALLRVGGANVVTQTYALTSPVDGEVLLRNINPGIEVQGQYSGGAGQELFTIGEIDRLWVLGNVYEMDIARVHPGTPASVTVVAYPGRVFKGQVDWVSGSIDPATRTATVRCTFDNPDRLLRPMMYATMQISVDQKRALAIPRGALLRVGGSKVVFIERGEDAGRVKFKRVEVDVDEGESSPMLEVKSGLQDGQKVVTGGAILLLAML